MRAFDGLHETNLRRGTRLSLPCSVVLFVLLPNSMDLSELAWEDSKPHPFGKREKLLTEGHVEPECSLFGVLVGIKSKAMESARA